MNSRIPILLWLVATSVIPNPTTAQFGNSQSSRIGSSNSRSGSSNSQAEKEDSEETPCRSYDLEDLKSQLTNVIQVLPQTITTLETHQNKENQVLESRLRIPDDDNIIFHFTGAVTTFKRAETSCKDRDMTFIQPNKYFASLLMKLKGQITQPSNFDFKSTALWIDLVKDLRTLKISYRKGSNLPLYWNDKRNNPVTAPATVDPAKCYVINVPATLNEDAAFTFAEKPCDSDTSTDKAYGLCQKVFSKQDWSDSITRDTYLTELKEYQKVLPDIEEAFAALKTNDFCDTNNVEENDDVFMLQQPTTNIKKLSNKNRKLPSLLRLLPGFVQDLTVIKSVFERLRYSRVSNDRSTICLCDIPPNVVADVIKPEDSVSQVDDSINFKNLGQNQQSTMINSQGNQQNSVSNNGFQNSNIGYQNSNLGHSGISNFQTSPESQNSQVGVLNSQNSQAERSNLTNTDDSIIDNEELSAWHLILAAVGAFSALTALLITLAMLCKRYLANRKKSKKCRKIVAVKMDTCQAAENDQPFLVRSNSYSDSENSYDHKIPQEVVLIGKAQDIVKNSTLQLNSKNKRIKNPKNTKRVKKVSIHESPSVVYKYANRPVSMASLSSEDGILPFEKAYSFSA